MPIGRRVWGLGKLLLLAGALGATFLLFFVLSMRVAVRAREVRVPALAGRTVNEASDLLAEYGLALRVDDNPRPDDAVAPGRIVQQDPAPGTDLRRGRTIRVWVSSGSRSTIVPRLVGQTERAAQIQMLENGLSIGTVAEFRSSDYPADTVAGQDPPADSPGPAVSLLVSRGGEAISYVMPDVIGMEGVRAADALRRRGFRVTIVGSQLYPGVPAGIIVQQQPPGGFQVARGDAISLEVSR